MIKTVIRYITLAGLIIGFFLAWLGFYLYRAYAQPEAEDLVEDPISFIGQCNRLFQKGLDALVDNPAKYIAVIGLIGSIIISAFLNGIPFFGLEIRPEYLIFTYFVASLLLGADSRVAIGMAIFFIIMCPFLIVFDDSKLAEQFAIFAYYFLVIGVFEQVIEYIKDQREKKRKALDARIGRKIKLTPKETMAETGVESATLRSRLESSKMRQKKKTASVWYLVSALVVVAVIVLAGGLFIRAGGTNRTRPSTDSSLSQPKDEAVNENTRDESEADEKEAILGNDVDTTQTQRQASVIVLNGGALDGEATRIKDVLEDAGKSVLSVDNSPEDHSETTIYYKAEFRDQAGIIAGDIANDYPVVQVEGSVAGFDADIIVVLGPDAIR